MNKLLIATAPESKDSKVFNLSLRNASNFLPALRSDHFVECNMVLDGDIKPKDLKFLMHITRLLTEDAKLIISGDKREIALKLVKNLGLHQLSENQTCISFSKNLPVQPQNPQNQTKLAIGMTKLSTNDQIDEDDLLKDEKINLNKSKFQSCADKPRACANCSCGRKQNEPLPSKEQLVKSVNEGTLLSGCGKCSMADTFRCGTCPYKGLPAFKPGDRLELMEDGKIVVEDGGVVVKSGKVTIQL